MISDSGIPGQIQPDSVSLSEGCLNLENLSFNTVDGFIYGIDFRFSKRWKNKTSFTISPEVDWAFSREELMWRVNGNYSFDRMKQRQIFFRTGMTSRDIGTGGGINTFLNSVTSLLPEEKLPETL